MQKLVALLLGTVSLFGQVPDLERFWWGKLVSIASNAELGRFEYTVWNGVDDAFTGVSKTPLRVRLNERVKCAVVEPRYVYIVDDDGKIQETTYMSQAQMEPRRRLPRWFPHW